MKHTRIAAFAALGLAAALSLTACNGDDSGADASSQGAATSNSSSSSSSSSSGGGSEAGQGPSGSGQDSKGGADATNGGGTSGGTKVTSCKTKDLAIDAQDAAPDEKTGRIDITMVNRGSTTCSATGFPGVDIKDADGTSSSTGRGQAQPRVTTLKPGDAAVFNLAYDIDDSGESMASPTHLLVTPPNETHTVTLKWPAGAGAIKGIAADVQVYPTHTTK
ncbi:hypothetical protein DEJ49_03390 [Streptomyces venezuelae]|uniref:DUF4232 domain-containing protein n=1 Tax=Streptomyces venezuelae TaxID=54571 RepID=A0A5P2CH65_STRVZ|nr:DUF4232 domain-containing protein [Streptomyces venezuelae]QES40149.1 hypothetical protein DEJ49_03390 [Streptomyces venezuelae]